MWRDKKGWRDREKKVFRVETKRIDYVTYEFEAEDEDEAREEYYNYDGDYGDGDEEVLSVEEL